MVVIDPSIDATERYVLIISWTASIALRWLGFFLSGATVGTVMSCPGLKRGITLSQGSFSGASNDHWAQRWKDLVSSSSLGTSLKSHWSSRDALRQPNFCLWQFCSLPSFTSPTDSGTLTCISEFTSGRANPATGAKQQTAGLFPWWTTFPVACYCLQIG